MNENTHSSSDTPSDKDFGPVIYSYTRAQALADGFQIDVTQTASEAGIRLPVFITRGVYELCVAVPLDGRGQPLTGQDEAGRLGDVIWMLRFAIIRAKPGASRLPVALYVRNSDKAPARLIKLVAVVSAQDIDNPAPAITVMLPDED